MYAVSDFYKEAVVKQEREWYLKIEVKKSRTAPTLVTLEGIDILSDTFKVSHQSTNNSSFTIGGVCASECSLTLSYYGVKKLQEEGLLRKNTCFCIKTWIKTSDNNQSIENISLNNDGTENTTGRVELGYFYIYDIGNLDQECDLKLYDSMLAFDKAISQKDALRLEQEERTIYNWAILFCESCTTEVYDLELSSEFVTSLVNNNIGVGVESISSINTYRDALGWLSILGCCFFTIGRDGRLEARKYTNTNKINIGNELVTEYSFGNNQYQVTAIKTSIAGFEYNKQVQTQEEGVLNADLYLNENPFLRGIQPDEDTDLSQNIKNCIDNIYNGMLGIHFFSGNFETTYRPEIDLGDCIDIEIQLVDISSDKQVYITKEYKNILVCNSVSTYGTYSTFRCNPYNEVTSKEKVSSSFKTSGGGGGSGQLSILNITGTQSFQIVENKLRDIFNIIFLLNSGVWCAVTFTAVARVYGDGLVTFIILYDGEEFLYSPKYTVKDGYDTFSFTIGLQPSAEDGVHSLLIRCITDNVDLTINAFEYQLMLNATGLRGGDSVDKLPMYDSVRGFNINYTNNVDELFEVF